MKYIVIDVETPNGKNDCICAVACMLLDGTKVVDEWYTLVDPEVEFEGYNISIHHITPDMVVGAPKFDEVWVKILEQSKGRIFVAHNAQFDLTVLSKALENKGREPLKVKYACTVQMAKLLHYNGEIKKGDLKLPNISSTLGVELESHHNALYDTRACAGIFLKLQEMYDFDMNDHVHQFDHGKPKVKKFRRKSVVV